MTQPWFLATRSFSPRDGIKWQEYVAWSQLAHLDEVVSLDHMLCPTILPDVKDEYWPHIVNEDFLLNFFVNLDFLLQQVATAADKNLLCVIREPDADAQSPVDPRFTPIGFDLVETHTMTSALVNCGGFPRAFQNSELTSNGLLPSLTRAREVQLALRNEYPEEPHAQCDVWQLSRAVAL
jgi:hypothetical protein